MIFFAYAKLFLPPTICISRWLHFCIVLHNAYYIIYHMYTCLIKLFLFVYQLAYFFVESINENIYLKMRALSWTCEKILFISIWLR